MTEFEKIPITLTRFARNYITHIDPKAAPLLHGEGDLCRLLDAIQTSCKIINRKVKRAFSEILLCVKPDKGQVLVDSINEGLEETKAFAHATLAHYLASWGQICVASSENSPDQLIFPKGATPGQFSVAFDPLDGYKNIDGSMATTFGVYRRLSDDGRSCGAEDLLQAPRRLLVAGYCLYGSRATLVLAIAGAAPAAFALDEGIGEFVVAHDALALPPRAGAGGICVVDAAHDGAAARCATPLERHRRLPFEGCDCYGGQSGGSRGMTPFGDVAIIRGCACHSAMRGRDRCDGAWLQCGVIAMRT